MIIFAAAQNNAIIYFDRSKRDEKRDKSPEDICITMSCIFSSVWLQSNSLPLQITQTSSVMFTTLLYLYIVSRIKREWSDISKIYFTLFVKALKVFALSYK